MTSACQAIWASARRPIGQRGGLAEDAPGVCALCGHVDDRTVPLTVACPPASFGGWQQIRNTVSDLDDCYEHMDRTEDLSPEERRARQRIIELARDIVRDFGDEEDDDDQEE